MFTPTLRCECAQPASDRLMRKWCITFLNFKFMLIDSMWKIGLLYSGPIHRTTLVLVWVSSPKGRKWGLECRTDRSAPNLGAC